LNKKQLFISGGWTIAWIVLGISSFGLNATPLELNLASDPFPTPNPSNKKQKILAAVTGTRPSNPKKTSTPLKFDPTSNLFLIFNLSSREKKFFEIIIGIRLLKSERIVMLENGFLGQGQYGKVYGGLYGKQPVVLKQAQEGKELFLEKEYENSKNFLLAVTEAYRMGVIPPILQPNIRFLVCSFGKTTDGRLVQKRINGRNAYEALKAREAPYTDGYPDDFRKAILRASNLFRVLSVLHRLGFIFGDIRPGNIVIENNPAKNYLCYFVDFGMLQKIGTHLPFCIFGQPVECLPQEYRAAHPIVLAWQEQEEQVISALQDIQSQLQSCPCASTDEDREQLTQKKQQLEARQSELQQELTNLYNHLPSGYPPAHPSFDIHQSVLVLKAILFGKSGSKILEDPIRFPSHILAQLQILFHRMLDHDPAKRPSAEEIAQTLQDISRSNWEE
jgi:serine/threonine protein kinase